MMGSAQRYRELVAYLASHRAELSEPQVVGVRGLRSDRGGFFCIKLFANRRDAGVAVAERALANWRCRRAAIRSKAGF